jgi:hypothetical protein
MALIISSPGARSISKVWSQIINFLVNDVREVEVPDLYESITRTSLKVICRIELIYEVQRSNQCQ